MMLNPGAASHSILSKKENAHSDAIYCSVWTKITETGDPKDPGKDYIVTGGLDSLVKVWTVDTNRLELFHVLKGHCLAILDIAVSPDGHTIASSSADSSIIIWELTTGNKIHEINAGHVWKLAFSPDGLQLASGAFMGKVHIYSVEKGVVMRTLDTRTTFGMSIAWSPNGQRMAVGTVNGSIHIFDVPQGKLVHSIKAHEESVRDLAFSPNSKLLVTASQDEKLKIYDVESATLQNTLKHEAWVTCVCFSRDGTRVISGAADGSVRVTHAAECNMLHVFREHSDSVCSVQFNSSSNKAMSVSKDKTINIYECPKPIKPEKIKK